MSLWEDVIHARESELASVREYVQRLEAQVADLLAKLEGKPAAATPVAFPAPAADPPAPEAPADPAPVVEQPPAAPESAPAV